MKAAKNANTINLDNEYVQMITNAIYEAAQIRFKSIEECQEDILKYD